MAVIEPCSMQNDSVKRHKAVTMCKTIIFSVNSLPT